MEVGTRPLASVRREQFAQQMFFEEKYAVPSYALRNCPAKARNDATEPPAWRAAKIVSNTGNTARGSTASSHVRIWLSQGMASIPKSVSALLRSLVCCIIRW